MTAIMKGVTHQLALVIGELIDGRVSDRITEQVDQIIYQQTDQRTNSIPYLTHYEEIVAKVCNWR